MISCVLLCCRGGQIGPTVFQRSSAVSLCIVCVVNCVFLCCRGVQMSTPMLQWWSSCVAVVLSCVLLSCSRSVKLCPLVLQRWSAMFSCISGVVSCVLLCFEDSLQEQEDSLVQQILQVQDKQLETCWCSRKFKEQPFYS